MGASCYVYGLIPADDKYKKILNAIKALSEAGVKELPSEIEEYFDGTDFDGYELEELLKELPENHIKVSLGCVDDLEIDLQQINPHITKIGFEWS